MHEKLSGDHYLHGTTRGVDVSTVADVTWLTKMINVLFSTHPSANRLHTNCVLTRGGFRHVRPVRPHRGPHKKGAPT